MSTRGWENVKPDQLPGRTGKTLTTNGSTAPKKSKYRNVKTTIDGQTFDSNREAQIWIELRARERAHEIWNLTRQVKWALHCPLMQSPRSDGSTPQLVGMAQVAEYISDFEWDEQQPGPAQCDVLLFTHVVADCKGHLTYAYRLKRKWMLIEHGVTIREMR